MKKIVILGISADIGRNLAKKFHADKFEVFGTYRSEFDGMQELLKLPNVFLSKCDLTLKKDITALADVIDQKKYRWSHLFSSVGTCEPIGNFFETGFDDWEHSVNVNFLSQARAIRELYRFRDTAIPYTHIALLAGAGTNNAFTNYSAYAVSKVALIKLCELLDDEAQDLNIFIVGPGFVKTKNHYETLRAGPKKAGKNYERVKGFMESNDQIGTSYEEIYACISWGFEQGREVVGGRNMSVVYDRWGDNELAIALRSDTNMYKIRRNGNEWGK